MVMPTKQIIPKSLNTLRMFLGIFVSACYQSRSESVIRTRDFSSAEERFDCE